MSFKIHFLHSLWNFVPENLKDVSNEHGKRFHQRMKSIERRYQGFWEKRMMGDYIWFFIRGTGSKINGREVPRETIDMTFENYELIAQGAEAKIYKGTYLNRSVLIKHRFKKKYRHEILDNSLASAQIKNEARAIARATTAGVLTPTIFYVDHHRRNIYMEYMENTVTLKKFIDDNISKQETFWQVAKITAKVLGNLIARLHIENIFHGDLTSSNILLRNITVDSESVKREQIALIDFGLAHVNCSVEDSAVDLYVLVRSLRSAHSAVYDLFLIILEGYLDFYIEKKEGEKGKQVLNKLKEVRSRGRKRVMIG